MWGLWWTKRHWGRFSPSISVSLANHSTDFSIIIITRDWHNRPLSGSSVEWTLIPTPTMQIKKKQPIFRRKFSPRSRGLKSKPSKILADFCFLLLRSVSSKRLLTFTGYKTLYSELQDTSYAMPWAPHIQIIICTYCHVFMTPLLIMTGSGLDDWNYWHLLVQSLLITINYSSSQ
jgi:hypothetical protein